MNRLALVLLLGAALFAVGVVVLLVSTDFNPNPFMENRSNETGQLAGVVVAAAGTVVLAIGAVGQSICRSIEARD